VIKGYGEESLPCIVCRKQMERVFEGGYELQPNDGLHFHSEGAYGSTVFDPMDLSTLDVVICDECIVKAGKDGIVRFDQPRIGLNDEDGVAAGFYCPEREAVIWDPEKQYPRQEPHVVTYKEIISGDVLKQTGMFKASAIKRAHERLQEENDE
jgi:hypothetical protein